MNVCGRDGCRAYDCAHRGPRSEHEKLARAKGKAARGDATSKQRDDLLAALEALVVSAEWHRKHCHPSVDEPNTGALDLARAAIAAAKEGT